MVAAGACAPQEQDNPFVGPTCHDGIRNQDEEEIDCGGRCQECEVYIPIVTPCASLLKNNVVNIDGFDMNLQSDGYYCSENTYQNFYELTVDQDGTAFSILLTLPLPAEDAVYTIFQELGFEPAQARVRMYENGSGPYAAYSGDIYIRVGNGKITAEFCDLDLQYRTYQYTSHRTVSGRISCP